MVVPRGKGRIYPLHQLSLSGLTLVSERDVDAVFKQRATPRTLDKHRVLTAN